MINIKWKYDRISISAQHIFAAHVQNQNKTKTKTKAKQIFAHEREKKKKKEMCDEQNDFEKRPMGAIRQNQNKIIKKHDATFASEG